MWQTLESKAKTITQIMKGDPNIRTIQDVDTNVLSYAEMKAIASGNPMILERVKVDTELKKLTLLKAQFHDSKLRMKFDLQAIPKEITFQEGLIKALEKDMATLEKHPAEPFSMVVDKKTFDEPEAAGSVLKAIWKGIARTTFPRTIRQADGRPATSRSATNAAIPRQCVKGNLGLDNGEIAGPVASRVRHRNHREGRRPAARQSMDDQTGEGGRREPDQDRQE